MSRVQPSIGIIELLLILRHCCLPYASTLAIRIVSFCSSNIQSISCRIGVKSYILTYTGSN